MKWIASIAFSMLPFLSSSVAFADYSDRDGYIVPYYNDGDGSNYTNRPSDTDRPYYSERSYDSDGSYNTDRSYNRDPNYYNYNDDQVRRQRELTRQQREQEWRDRQQQARERRERLEQREHRGDGLDIHIGR